MVQMLIDAGADPGARNEDGESPFDKIPDESPLKGSDVYWVLNDAHQSASQNLADPGQRWGPELVYEGDIGYRPCGSAADTPNCLRDLGLSEDAIAFSYAVENDYSGATVGIAFRELGEVDLVEAQFIGNTVYHFPVLVNGQNGLRGIPPTRNLSRNFRDRASNAMLRRFPRAASGGPGWVRAHRTLADGTQRFVFVETIVNGCRACPVLGSAISFIEISPNGSSQRRPIGLLLSAPSERDETAEAIPIRPRELLQRPTSIQARLNLLGYEAGPMDGVIGERTQAALSQFKVDRCMPTNPRLDEKTARHLLELDGFTLPCRPDQGRDADLQAEARGAPEAELREIGRNSSAHPLLGSWTGQYHCGQGLTSFRLTTTDEPIEDGVILGLFEFFPHPSNPGVPEGSFEVRIVMTGNSDFIVEPVQWIDRPMGFRMISSSGSIEGNSRILGDVDGSTCGDFYAGTAEDGGQLYKPQRTTVGNGRTEEPSATAAGVDFNARRADLQRSVEILLQNGSGDLEALAGAMETNRLQIVERLEDGVQLEMPFSEDFETITYDNQRRYRVTFSMKFPFRQLDYNERQQQLNKRFTWELFRKQSQTASISRPLRVQCIYSEISDIPKSTTVIEASLRSLSKDNRKWHLEMDCRS